ncbi:uncharacterized protein QYS62_007421 [Fusarium acuminatum]|uniref:Myb-like domain-containing protein n=1 Tax=Fusarium acuminatum TaxID=5515 RepID=A0ABZ2WZV7_9HYPO
MNSKNWNDRADKDLFFTILSVKNIGVISGSEWTTIGNHMRCLGYGFTNEGCRQHFQGLRRAQNKSDTAGPNGEPVRRHDPTMNPITRRPGPGRGRPRKQPPVPVDGAPGEAVPSSPLTPGIVPRPPNSAPPYPHPHPQVAPAYGAPPGNHQSISPLPAQAAMRPANISPAPPAQQVPAPNDIVPAQGPVTYPSPPRTTDLTENSAHIQPLQPDQPNQPNQPDQPDQHPESEQTQLGQQSQPNYPSQPGQQAQQEVQSQPITQLRPDQEGQPDYQPESLQQEPPPEIREATDTSAASQPPPLEQGLEHRASIISEGLQHIDHDIDADGDAEGDDEGDAEGDAEADVDNDEPNAKRQRLSSPEPSKNDDMDHEAVLALAAHNGSSDFASE